MALRERAGAGAGGWRDRWCAGVGGGAALGVRDLLFDRLVVGVVAHRFLPVDDRGFGLLALQVDVAEALVGPAAPVLAGRIRDELAEVLLGFVEVFALIEIVRA